MRGLYALSILIGVNIMTIGSVYLYVRTCKNPVMLACLIGYNILLRTCLDNKMIELIIQDDPDE